MAGTRILHFLLALQFLSVVNCGNVLVLCPASARSHVNVLSAVYMGLADKGHNITVLSPWKSDPHVNVHDIISVENYDLFEDVNVLDVRRIGAHGFLQYDLRPLIRNSCEAAFNNPQVMMLLNSTVDLVIMDATYNECMYGFVHVLRAPLIVVFPVPMTATFGAFVGNRLPSSFVPFTVVSSSDRMNLIERTLNIIAEFIGCWGYMNLLFPVHEDVYREYLGADIPGVEDLIVKHVSMVFSNSHFAFNFPRPTLPDVVEIGGAHCRAGKRLPEEIEDFVVRAKRGLILFSLGTNVKPHQLPEQTRIAFINTFRNLKQRVLWKWPTSMPDLPPNVKISKWIPQQDVLAHHNTRLFITHAGLLSTQEAIYHKVPMISIPFFADQDANAYKSALLGISETVEIIGLTESTLSGAIQRVLRNTTMQFNIDHLSRLMRDQPQSAKERAVFWAEYVMRHKGTRHIRSAARDLNFWQYYCIDVAIAIVSTSLALCWLVWKIVRATLGKLLGCFRPAEGVTKKSQ